MVHTISVYVITLSHLGIPSVSLLTWNNLKNSVVDLGETLTSRINTLSTQDLHIDVYI